jgi:hypothetical protein
MRLLNTNDLTLQHMSTDIPNYAVLSHTWEDAEVTFADMQDLTIATKLRGFAKVLEAAQIARAHDYNWIWIDTCCIDKTNNLELSESINSMFTYYKNSGVCIAYLLDVDGSEQLMNVQFRNSRWFTRGWTLQELIAPTNMLFYGQNWNLLGTKSDLVTLIHSACGVDAYVLRGGDISNISISRRMYWAAKRVTSKAEDMAYCLLGLFDIHMPLLYGEGPENAFLRLQKEILKTSDDQSLFAWRREDNHAIGLLARRPSAFADSHNLSALRRQRANTAKNLATQTNMGLQMKLLTARYRNDRVIILDCQVGPQLSTYPIIHGSMSSLYRKLDRLTGVRFAERGKDPDYLGISPLQLNNREAIICSGLYNEGKFCLFRVVFELTADVLVQTDLMI